MNVEHEWTTIEVGDETWKVSRDALRVDGVRINPTFREALEWAKRFGAQMPPPRVLDARWREADLKNRFHCQKLWEGENDGALHSRLIDEDIAAHGSAPRIVGNPGKPWTKKRADGVCELYGIYGPRDKATTYRGTLMCWGLPVYESESGETSDYIAQRSSDSSHNDEHGDYMTVLLLAIRLSAPETAPDSDPYEVAGETDSGDEAEAEGQSDPETATPPSMSRPGDDEETVKAWQCYLISEGYELPKYGADGDHGPETEAATAKWLADRGFESVDEPVPDTQPAPLLPPIVFRQAHDYQAGRPNGVPCWLVIHTAECREVAVAAENLQSWATGDIDASWHYAVDCDSITQSVREDDRAWTVGSGPAHERGIHIELAGTARQSLAEWDDTYSRAVLELGARLAAGICRRHDIPVERRSATELRSGSPGLCGHVDVTDAWHHSTHRDPGVHFPWDRFLAMVRSHLD